MKHIKWILIAVALSAGGTIAFVAQMIWPFLTIIAVMMWGLTIECGLEYFSEPKGQRNKILIIGIAYYMGFAIVFTAFALYMFSRYVGQ